MDDLPHAEEARCKSINNKRNSIIAYVVEDIEDAIKRGKTEVTFDTGGWPEGLVEHVKLTLLQKGYRVHGPGICDTLYIKWKKEE